MSEEPFEWLPACSRNVLRNFPGPLIETAFPGIEISVKKWRIARDTAIPSALNQEKAGQQPTGRCPAMVDLFDRFVSWIRVRGNEAALSRGAVQCQN
jgi:hypothetical protein